MTESSTKNGYLAVAPPQTPRSRTTSSGRLGVTPLFSFGLGFLPSFQLNSAKKFSSISPRNYLQTGNDLNRVINRKQDEEDDLFKREGRRKEDDIFGTLTPPTSSNKFLDTLKFHTNNNSGNDTLTSQESLDLWTLGNDTNHTQLGNLAGFEDTKNPIFLTPRKLVVENQENIQSIEHKEGNQSGGNEGDKLIQIQPKNLKHNHSEKNLTEMFSKPKKRRKVASLANGITDSPNNSIASQIDMAIESPSARRKSHISETLDNATDKVWYDELDDVLIKSYTKYIHFRRNQSFDSSILKHTSQNKVLSRMLLNKTGILRTANQISSRLFRLAKMKKLTKAKNKTDTHDYDEEFSIQKNDIDDVMATPLESLISSTANIDNAKNNELIDKELDLIFSSPELQESLHSSPFDTQSSHIEFCASELVLSFKNTTDASKSHTFSSLNPYSAPSLNEIALKKELVEDFKSKLLPTVISRLSKEHKPFLLINNKISLNPNSELDVHLSPYRDKIIDTANGTFVSYMKINVLNCPTHGEPILNWNCLIKVYNKEDLLFESIDLINAYKKGNSYELNIPFIKKFWPGYLSFLNEGADDETIKDLVITQVFFDNDNNTTAFDENQSNIFGCIVHKFYKTTQKGVSVVVTNNLLEDRVEDDNATVVANSSPYKPPSSSPIMSEHYETDINKSVPMKPLVIDVNKANRIASGGHASAPVYNANLVYEFNQKLLLQKEGRNMLPEKPNQSQPLLPHSQSATVVQQYHMEQPTRSNSYCGGLQSASTPVNVHKDLITSTPNQQVAFLNNSIKQDSQAQQQYMYSQTSSIHTGAVNNLQENNMNTSHNQQHLIPPTEKVNFGRSPQFNQMNPAFSAPASQTHFFRQLPNNGQEGTQQNMTGQMALMQIPHQMQMQMQMQMQHPPQQQMGTQMPIHFQQQMQQMQQLQQQHHHQQQPQQQQQQQQQQPQQHQQNQIMPHQLQQMQQMQQPIQQSVPKSQSLRSTSKSSKESIKENINPNGIKFGPILEYDPSKNAPPAPSAKSSKPSMTGVYRFPLNTQVMYKPKKN